VPHVVTGVYGAGRVLIRPASPGTGVIAGPVVRAMLDARSGDARGGILLVHSFSDATGIGLNVLATMFATLDLHRSRAMERQGATETDAALAASSWARVSEDPKCPLVAHIDSSTLDALSVAYNLASVVEGDGPTPHPIAKVKLPRTDTNTNK